MDPTPPPAYRASVPAVARAVRALEHLASAQQPMSLSVLARAGNISPSSLLAILTTLRATGLVSRSPKDGRYLPGPGLVALGTAAAQCLEPLHAFDMLATDLVETLGETVLLWIQQGDGLAMAAVREGTRPLRYVPTLGLRLPAGGWASTAQDGIVEGELEPGVWVLAVPLDEHALLAVVGPDLRLKGEVGATGTVRRSGSSHRRPPSGPSTYDVTHASHCPSASRHRRCVACWRAVRSRRSTIPTGSGGVASRAGWRRGMPASTRRGCSKVARSSRGSCYTWRRGS